MEIARNENASNMNRERKNGRIKIECNSKNQMILAIQSDIWSFISIYHFGTSCVPLYLSALKMNAGITGSSQMRIYFHGCNANEHWVSGGNILQNRLKLCRRNKLCWRNIRHICTNVKKQVHGNHWQPMHTKQSIGITSDDFRIEWKLRFVAKSAGFNICIPFIYWIRCDLGAVVGCSIRLWIVYAKCKLFAVVVASKIAFHLNDHAHHNRTATVSHSMLWLFLTWQFLSKPNNIPNCETMWNVSWRVKWYLYSNFTPSKPCIKDSR